MAKEPLLELAKLNRVSADGVELLCDISLRVVTGDRLALRGKSGSGKTLLLRSLAALDPVHDRLRWRGRRIPPKSIPEYRSQAIYLQQTPALPLGTVEEALEEPFSWAANSDLSYERGKAIEILQRLNRRASFLGKRTTDLSGGESSLLAIVRALQLEPTVLLLDEPTSAMDKETTFLVEALLRDWVRQADRAYVWVTHDDDQAARIADRAVQLLDGKLVR